MNKDECEQNGGTWDDVAMMCTHPEEASAPSEDAASDANEPETM